MKFQELKKIKRLYFGYEDISGALGITRASARVTANRYAEQGILVRVKRNIYVLREKWSVLDKEEKFMLANLIQVPSYISLMTAMEYYGITTQVQRDFIESVAVKRSKETAVDGTVFNFSKMDKKLYFAFKRVKGFFIAEPEKAFLDSLYLMSLKRYGFDMTSIERDKMDAGKLRRTVKKYPQRTQRMLKKWMT